MVSCWMLTIGPCRRVRVCGSIRAAVIEEAIQALLPEPFHDAECFWQLSSSAGFVLGVLKVHLCYWLSEAQDNAYLRAWFKHFAPYIDIAPFNAVQPHYVADPKIEQGDDPLRSEPVGDMAQYRQSPCRPCRMWRIVPHTRACISRIPRLVRPVCTPRASPTPWRGWAMVTDWKASIDPCWRHPCTRHCVHRGGTLERRAVHRGPRSRD